MRALLYLLPALVLGLTDAPAQGGPGDLTPPPPPAKPAQTPAAAKPATPSRLPVPSLDERKQGEKLVRELFKDGYAKRTPEGRRDLAAKLLASARGTKDDPAGLYVLLSEAAELAATAGDVKTAIAAVSLLTRRFDVDASERKAETLDRARRAVRTPEAARELAGAYLAAAGEARIGDDYDGALDLLKKAESVARSARDAAVRADIQGQAREIRDLQKEFRKIQPSLAKLETDPDDPASNKTYGTYLCFIKGSWKEGLPHLARSGDERLEKVARLETSASKERDAGIRCDLAELYYTIAEESKSTPLMERNALARCLGWYRAALRGNLQGLARVRAQRRIEEIEKKAIPEAPAGRALAIGSLTPNAQYVLKDGESVLRKDAPDIVGRSIRIEASLKNRAEGVIVSQGGRLEGYSLYIKNGRLTYATMHASQRSIVTAPQALPSGGFTVGAVMTKSGRVTLFINGRAVMEGKVPGTWKVVPNDSLMAGQDTITTVGDHPMPFRYGGIIHSVRVQLGDE